MKEVQKSNLIQFKAPSSDTFKLPPSRKSAIESIVCGDFNADYLSVYPQAKLTFLLKQSNTYCGPPKKNLELKHSN